MDWEIKLGCAPRERRRRKTTRATAIVNNEIAMTKSAACWPAEAMVTGMGVTGGAEAGGGAVAGEDSVRASGLTGGGVAASSLFAAA